MIKCDYNVAIDDFIKSARPCTTKCMSFMNGILKKVRSFDVFDFAVFKMCMFSFGLIIGAKMAKCVKKFFPLLALVALTTSVYLAFKIFFDEE